MSLKKTAPLVIFLSFLMLSCGGSNNVNQDPNLGYKESGSKVELKKYSGRSLSCLIPNFGCLTYLYSGMHSSSPVDGLNKELKSICDASKGSIANANAAECNSSSVGMCTIKTQREQLKFDGIVLYNSSMTDEAAEQDCRSAGGTFSVAK